MPTRAAIVTGASRGIGFAIAETLGEQGYGLTLTARKPEGMMEMSPGSRCGNITPRGSRRDRRN